MELIEQIIYLGRIKSAMDDAATLAEREQFREQATRVGIELDRMADLIEASIMAHPEGSKFMASDLIALERADV